MAGRRPRGAAERNPRLAEQIAQTAARLMSEEGVRDFGFAKRKAAERLGLSPNRNLPSNIEVERALVEYQRLFRAASQSAHLQRLRTSALQAMQLLEPFRPRLVGPVLAGTAGSHYPITLHLFTDMAEEIGFFLEERNIPYRLDRQRVRLDSERQVDLPQYRFTAGDDAVELTVFPFDGLRQPPLSPVDGRPMQRASVAQVEGLLEESAGG